MSNAVLRAIPVVGQRAGPVSRNARCALAEIPRWGNGAGAPSVQARTKMLSEPGTDSLRLAPEAYWTYEDIGAFLFVAVALDTVVRLAVRLHLLDSSQLLAPSPALETLIPAFPTAGLYVILKWHYRKPVVAPLGWLLPSRFYTAISILGGVV